MLHDNTRRMTHLSSALFQAAAPPLLLAGDCIWESKADGLLASPYAWLLPGRHLHMSWWLVVYLDVRSRDKTHLVEQPSSRVTDETWYEIRKLCWNRFDDRRHNFELSLQLWLNWFRYFKLNIQFHCLVSVSVFYFPRLDKLLKPFSRDIMCIARQDKPLCDTHHTFGAVLLHKRSIWSLIIHVRWEQVFYYFNVTHLGTVVARSARTYPALVRPLLGSVTRRHDTSQIACTFYENSWIECTVCYSHLCVFDTITPSLTTILTDVGTEGYALGNVWIQIHQIIQVLYPIAKRANLEILLCERRQIPHPTCARRLYRVIQIWRYFMLLSIYLNGSFKLSNVQVLHLYA